jgi:hypothetical protein
MVLPFLISCRFSISKEIWPIVEVSGEKSQEEMAVIFTIPLWQRGMKGDFKNKCLNLPSPLFAKRGEQKRQK